MDKEAIEKRIAMHKQEADNLLRQRESIEAQYNAKCGAIRECEYWLSVLNTPAKAKRVKK